VPSDSSSNDIFPVVIIGAGIAGLSAAVHLAERGLPPLVLEADSRWAGGRLAGGDADTFTYGGRTWAFKPDHGVHAVWGSYHNLRAMLNRFHPVMLNASPGEEWINRWGREVRHIEAGNAVRSRWLPAPFHYLQLLFHPHIWRNIIPLDFLSLPGFLASILLTVGLDPLGEEIALEGLTMQEYFRGWTPNLRATFTGLAQNLLAAPAESISLAAFIAAMRFYTVLRRDTWRLEYFPANSHDSLIQPLITAIEAREGMVMLGAEAQRLERQGDGWRVVVHDARRGGARSLLAEQIILATDAPAAKRLLLAGPDTAECAAQIKFPNGLRNNVVRLWFDAQPRDGAPGGMLTGDFEADNFFWLHRLYEEFAGWRETGGSAVEMHFYGTPSKLDQPDKNLLILAITEIQRAFPEMRGHFVHGVVRRNSQTQTQFAVPTADSLHVKTPWENVYACGDWIGYPTPSFWLERSTITGIAAANFVLNANGRALYPILPPSQPERLVRILAIPLRVFRKLFAPPFRTLARLRRGVSSRSRS
jgi:hypothetical protein